MRYTLILKRNKSKTLLEVFTVYYDSEVILPSLEKNHTFVVPSIQIDYYCSLEV